MHLLRISENLDQILSIIISKKKKKNSQTYFQLYILTIKFFYVNLKFFHTFKPHILWKFVNEAIFDGSVTKTMLIMACSNSTMYD